MLENADICFLLPKLFFKNFSIWCIYFSLELLFGSRISHIWSNKDSDGQISGLSNTYFLFSCSLIMSCGILSMTTHATSCFYSNCIFFTVDVLKKKDEELQNQMTITDQTKQVLGNLQDEYSKCLSAKVVISL